jgi:uncharacterized MnhB-related membrane protein
MPCLDCPKEKRGVSEIARFTIYLLFGAILFVLFIFARKRFQQVVLVGGLSILAGVVFRLFSLRDIDKTEMTSEAYFLVGIGVLYGLVWLGTRYFLDRPRSARPRPPKS